MDVIIADVIGEVALILVVSSLLGMLAQRCGQPRVVGQIIAGIALGPTVLGQLPGHLTSHVFPKSTMVPMNVLANFAIVIFMFVVGYELDLGALPGHRRTAPLVAGGALLVPMALGAGAVLVFRSGFESLGEPHRITQSFVLFMAVILSITALPVLAAIVRERGIAGTRRALPLLPAAGIMDVLAWLLLAAALLGTTHTPGRPLVMTVILVAAFVAAMLAGVRPLLRLWLARPGSLLTSPLPIALTLALGTAWVTYHLGPASGLRRVPSTPAALRDHRV